MDLCNDVFYSPEGSFARKKLALDVLQKKFSSQCFCTYHDH